MGSRHSDRIGLPAFIEQPLALGLPDPELLGNILGIDCPLGRAAGSRRVSFAHGVPA